MSRKTLVIFSNRNMDGLVSNDDIDFFIDDTIEDINQLYFQIEKIYNYYLFIVDNIKFVKNEKDDDEVINVINLIVEDLKKYKPVIMKFDNKIKIYHRSILHYIFPLINIYKTEKINNISYDFLNIIEYPIEEYIYHNRELDIKYLDNKDKIKEYDLMRYENIDFRKLYSWIFSAFKEKMPKYRNFYQFMLYKKTKRYCFIDEDIDKINFMKSFNVHDYFDTEHRFFKGKMIRFYKNNREIYGETGTYHFIHDFGNCRRENIINHLIKVYDYQSYLEIGTYNCYHFDDILTKYKIGVDPSPKIEDPIYQRWKKHIFVKTSEEFFRDLGVNIKFDIIFLDGCLLENNIKSDIYEALKHLSLNGTLVVHDCNPPNEFFQRDNYLERYRINRKKKIIWNNKEYTDQHWNGKTWKVIAELRSTRGDLNIEVIDADWGLGIIRFGQQKLFDLVPMEDIFKYQTLMRYRKYLLNLISVEEFLEKY